MPDRTPISLTPRLIELNSSEFAEIASWKFPDSFVPRLLKEDLPHRMVFDNCRIWIYREPSALPVGFGTMQLSTDCSAYTGGVPHPFIPLLAVNPGIKSLGYGTTILKHLVAEAVLLASHSQNCADVLFLEVYAHSRKAMSIYLKEGFVPLTDEPRPDPTEGSPYFIMAKRISVDRPTLFNSK